MSSLPARSDLPTIDAHSQPYWEAASQGRLLVARCGSCGRAHHYPRPFCPHCWSDDVAAEEASGGATLYTYSTVFMNDLAPFRDRLPYIAAVVDLDEGPRLVTNIVGAEPDQLALGMRLQVDFRALTDDVSVPVFRPA